MVACHVKRSPQSQRCMLFRTAVRGKYIPSLKPLKRAPLVPDPRKKSPERVFSLKKMSHHVEYGKADYWDERYTRDEESFDWYQKWHQLKPELSRYFKPTDKLLMIGCGNALLSEDMCKDGYDKIVNIDISSVVIKKMTDRNPHMTWLVMDVTKMDSFADGSFDSILDKGTLDAILCGDNSMHVAGKMLDEIHRVLKPGGVFVDITYGIPDTRICYLERDGLNWAVETRTILKNEPKGIEGDCHYVYVCRKKH